MCILSVMQAKEHDVFFIISIHFSVKDTIKCHFISECGNNKRVLVMYYIIVYLYVNGGREGVEFLFSDLTNHVTDGSVSIISSTVPTQWHYFFYV